MEGSKFVQDEGKLIVVSNRLPVTVTHQPNGEWTTKKSSGGLVSALEGLQQKQEFFWLGWPGATVKAEDQERCTHDLEKQKYFPVFLDKDLEDGFYNGFSNSVLWPICHYLPYESQLRDRNEFDKWWKAYKLANLKFAEAVLQLYKPNDRVWIQDYQLMLLPGMLRQKNSEMKLGFFHHIPFPSKEIWQTLPKSRDLLFGLLACDLVAFHTYDYARHFLSCCSKIAGVETTPTACKYNGRLVTVHSAPVGITPSKYDKYTSSEEFETELVKIRESTGDEVKIIVGVDRLDPIKGVPHKLKGYARFLEENPEYWREKKVVLVQIAVPSRENVESFKKLKDDTDTLVGEINSKYGSVGYQPIRYLYKSVPPIHLAALYTRADACMISSIRDGMNLVASEYVACQRTHHGVLLLSEFAGCSSAMGGALLFNPWSAKEISQCIKEALNMKPADRKTRHDINWNYVQTFTAAAWSDDFLSTLECAATSNKEIRKKEPLTPELLREKWLERQQKRVLILPSDGVVMPFRNSDDPGFLPDKDMRDTIRELAADPRNAVYITSGRGMKELTKWFKNVNVGLVAEYGAFVRPRKEHSYDPDPEIEESELHRDMSWWEQVQKILEHFVATYPGSSLAKKKTGFTWNYRNTVDSVGWANAIRDIRYLLDSSKFPVYLRQARFSLEIHPAAHNMASVVKQILFREKPYDFVLYFGEPVQAEYDTDESAVFSCSVHTTDTVHDAVQKYYVTDDTPPYLLRSLVELGKDSSYRIPPIRPLFSTSFMNISAGPQSPLRSPSLESPWSYLNEPATEDDISTLSLYSTPDIRRPPPRRGSHV